MGAGLNEWKSLSLERIQNPLQMWSMVCGYDVHRWIQLNQGKQVEYKAVPNEAYVAFAKALREEHKRRVQENQQVASLEALFPSSEDAVLPPGASSGEGFDASDETGAAVLPPGASLGEGFDDVPGLDDDESMDDAAAVTPHQNDVDSPTLDDDDDAASERVTYEGPPPPPPPLPSGVAFEAPPLPPPPLPAPEQAHHDSANEPETQPENMDEPNDAQAPAQSAALEDNIRKLTQTMQEAMAVNTASRTEYGETEFQQVLPWVLIDRAFYAPESLLWPVCVERLKMSIPDSFFDASAIPGASHKELTLPFGLREGTDDLRPILGEFNGFQPVATQHHIHSSWRCMNSQQWFFMSNACNGTTNGIRSSFFDIIIGTKYGKKWWIENFWKPTPISAEFFPITVLWHGNHKCPFCDRMAKPSCICFEIRYDSFLKDDQKLGDIVQRCVSLIPAYLQKSILRNLVTDSKNKICYGTDVFYIGKDTDMFRQGVPWRLQVEMKHGEINCRTFVPQLSALTTTNSEEVLKPWYFRIPLMHKFTWTENNAFYFQLLDAINTQMFAETTEPLTWWDANTECITQQYTNLVFDSFPESVRITMELLRVCLRKHADNLADRYQVTAYNQFTVGVHKVIAQIDMSSDPQQVAFAGHEFIKGIESIRQLSTVYAWTADPMKRWVNCITCTTIIPILQFLILTTTTRC